jgi:hypothetical protein
VVGIPRPKLRFKRTYINRRLGQSASRSILLCRMNWGMSFDNAVPTKNEFSAGAQFLLIGRWLMGADLGARRRVKTASFRPRSPCSRFAAAAFSSFHLLQTRYLRLWLPPQVQNLSCCFGVTYFPNRCASPQATHLGA